MQSIEQVILLLVSGQGILISLALLTSIFRRNYASFCLGLISFVITLEILNAWATGTSYHNSEHPFPFWIFGSYLILPPALWLFLRANTIFNFVLRPRHALLFLPALIEILVEFFLFYWNSYFGGSYRLIDNGFWFFFTEVCPIILMVITLISFLRALLKMSRKSADTLTMGFSKEAIKLWGFFGVFALLTIFWVLQGLFQFQVFWIIEIILLLFLFIIAYLGYFKPSFFAIPKATQTRSVKEKYPQYQDTEELARLEQLFRVDKLYRQQKLNVKDVATQLQLPQRYISELINTYHHTNFNAYINSFRVAEVLERINDPKEKNKTLLGIALECGFNSKSSFNQIFKDVTGKKPSDFLKET
ncbi:helix-turn-helix domain-containing protein [Spongiimicrobium salis]|uniref:helix-turn-helix domain-containing protein n=1 Tax=Spongiimicrobium salis TaxID=1667022 RepID=UPI00374D6E3B